MARSSAHYVTFRDQLTIAYPAFGHALWEPDPGELPPVEVGDVGFVRDGKFHRLFNTLLPEDHPSHESRGVPEGYERLEPHLRDHIDGGILVPNNLHSHGVSIVSGGLEALMSGIGSAEVSFSCKKKNGAVLTLPVSARRKDTLAQGQFRKWIIKQIGSWFAFTQGLGLGIEPEDIVLVTGCHRTRSWSNIVFSEVQSDARLSLGVEVGAYGASVNWRVSSHRIQGAVLGHRTNGENLPEDQCIFIRGFRVKRVFGIIPWIRAAAEPKPDTPGNHPEPENEGVTSVTEYPDPLHVLLEYIAKREPQCDMVLVHDDDLERILGGRDDTSLETLHPDAIMDFLERSKPEIEVMSYPQDSPANANNQGPRTYVNHMSVAMLSEHIQSLEPPAYNPLFFQFPVPSDQSRNVEDPAQGPGHPHHIAGLMTASSPLLPSIPAYQPVYQFMPVSGVPHPAYPNPRAIIALGPTDLDPPPDQPVDPENQPPNQPEIPAALYPPDNPYLPRGQRNTLVLDPNDFAFPDHPLTAFPPTPAVETAYDIDGNASEAFVPLEDHEFSPYFQEIGWPPRVFHSHGSYDLPVDDNEIKRQEAQHILLRMIIGSNYDAPVRDLLDSSPGRRKVVDLCTGAGHWILEMAREFPHVQFRGLDLVPIQTRFYPPQNVIFEVADVTERLSFADASVDVVHARMTCLSADAVPGLLREVSRILRPGGLFLSADWDTHPTLHPSHPWAERLEEHIPQTLTFYDIASNVVPTLAPSIATLIHQNGSFEGLVSRRRAIPISAPYEEGSDGLPFVSEVMERVAKGYADALVVADRVPLDVAENFKAELSEKSGIVCVYQTVFARKMGRVGY